MKITFLAMTAVAALSAAAPAAAKDWQDNPSQSAALRMQIDEGVRSGAISSRDTPALRDGLRELVMMERQFSLGGITRREGTILQQRGSELGRQIELAERGGGYQVAGDGGRAAWEGRYDRDHRAAWEARYLSDRSAQADSSFGREPSSASNDRFDRPNRGDRFAGDVRVGQHFSSRMGPVPVEYRTDYQDNPQVYYGYDNQRIYRVDRRTGLILGLIDLSN
jgi:hypothetical protein